MSCQPSGWLAGLQIAARECSPEYGHGPDAGCVAGEDVVDRVADEDGVSRLTGKPLQRDMYGLGIGFVSR